MPTFVFDCADIERWANFSGDRNPIHFNRHAASRLGAADVIVHGMIPALMAQSVAYQSREPSPGGWTQSSVRMQRPVQCGQSLQFNARPTSDGLRFGLCNTQDGASHLSGRLTSTTTQPGPTAETPIARVAVSPHSFILDDTTTRARMDACGQVFPMVRAPWLRLSAVLFSEFLTRIVPALQVAARQQLEAGQLERGFVVQTYQSIRFDENYFSDRQSRGAYRCDVAPVLLFPLPEGGAAEYGAQVHVAGRCVMEYLVGLLIKSPPHPN